MVEESVSGKVKLFLCTYANDTTFVTQESSSQNNNVGQKALAISFRQAKYGYTKRHAILKDLDVSVPVGSIYGLLGPSGCGKTTLLQCIVGKRRLQSGRISVFGSKPGTPQAGVPGPRVGYMPQELALYNEFTIQVDKYIAFESILCTDNNIFHRRL